MNPHLPKWAYVIGLTVGFAGHLAGQTFTVLHTLGPAEEGRSAKGRLVLSGNTLYGTASIDGSGASGTIFSVNTDGSDFRVLHSFYLFTDGSAPLAGLTLSANTLYGTTSYGGDPTNQGGTVFAINTDGTGFRTLHNFTGPDGGGPSGELTLSGSTLYGTTTYADSGGQGGVFAIETDGSGFRTICTFTGWVDGGNPHGGLVLLGNALYGTTEHGGNSVLDITLGFGSVFTVNTDGTGFLSLYSFSLASGPQSGPVTNIDGANPLAGLLLSGDTLYGTASQGGPSGSGTVFAVGTDGTGFRTLHAFDALVGSPPAVTNADGATPVVGLVQSGTTLYGAAPYGGAGRGGTIFSVNTDGTGFRTLYSFGGQSDGGDPCGGLILTNNTLYGTTLDTIFSISLATTDAPSLSISRQGSNVLLTWPTNAAGFGLQAAASLPGPSVWTTNLPAPAVVNGQFTVTNPISGAQQFFRLSQ